MEVRFRVELDYRRVNPASDGEQKSPQSERYRLIAASLVAVPRYLAREKVRLLGVEGVASVVASVADDPDEHTRGLVDEPGGLRCSVCKVVKHQVYFVSDRSSEGKALCACKYCRWRIKSKAYERYRAQRGLPPKAKDNAHEEPTSMLSSEKLASLDAFLHERKQRPPDLREAKVCLPREARSSGGFYGFGFADISSGWYSETEDENYASGRREIAAWWSDEHDAVIEWFLRLYGMFVLASCRGIELEVNRLRSVRRRSVRYFEYFVLDRIRTRTHLWNIYASDFRSRYQLKTICVACGETEPLVSIHPDNLKASTGKVLPLCNLHWKTYRRATGSGLDASAGLGDVDVGLDSALRTHRCPVCESDHSWKDRTYTYTNGFYGIPDKHREICFDCFNRAVNQQGRSYATKRDLGGILSIYRITEQLPVDDSFKVITEQAETLAAATAVVRLLKKMPRFETLKRKYGSWFAVLARSGCLPEGSRREVYGTRILAKDGHECLSMAEMKIDNELHSLGIPHLKEVPYPNATFVCDWVVHRGDELVFVEFFGLAGRANYDERIVLKRAALHQSGHELIELYNEDLPRLRQRLDGLVSTAGRRKRGKRPPKC